MQKTVVFCVLDKFFDTVTHSVMKKKWHPIECHFSLEIKWRLSDFDDVFVVA